MRIPTCGDLQDERTDARLGRVIVWSLTLTALHLTPSVLAIFGRAVFGHLGLFLGRSGRSRGLGWVRRVFVHRIDSISGQVHWWLPDPFQDRFSFWILGDVGPMEYGVELLLWPCSRLGHER